MTLRAKLREAVTKRLVPELERRGFTGPDKISGNAISHDFLRKRSGRDERLSVQFEKRQMPRFILNVWVKPPSSIENPVEGEEPQVHGRISPGRGGSTASWFRADRPFWQRLVGIRSSLEDEAVTQALARLDAIDEWFQNPRETDVVRVLSNRHRNPGKDMPNQSPQPTQASGLRG